MKGLLASSLFNFFAILFISALFAEFIPGRKLLKVTSFALASYALMYLVFVEGRTLTDALVLIAVGILAVIDIALKAAMKAGAQAAVVPKAG